jgi:anionic cell wall polymer biosynthesis LytR-Cps2A-Psr (LCP) family protein
MVFYEARMRSPQFGMRDVMVDGVRMSAATLLKNFSVISDHYLAIDLNQLPQIIDAIGGIPINVPEQITDLSRPILIKAGQQTLNGAQTVDYSRAFMGTDFARIERNQVLLEAMRQRLLDPAVWPRIPELYTKFSDVIVTDFTLEQITHLSCLLKKIASDSVLQEGVRPEWTSPGPNSSLLWDQNKLLTRLKELNLIP